MKKRILSLFLAVVMLALGVPAMALTAFATESAANAAPTVSTTFSADSGNFPAYKDETGAFLSGYSLDWKGGWSFGSLPLNTENPATLADVSFGTTLNVYNARNNYTNVLGDFISSGSAGWNGGSDSYPIGAVCFMTDGRLLLVSGTRTDSTGVTVQKNQTAVRYTAQYTGDVTVTVKGDWFDHHVHQALSASYANLTVGYAHIYVLKNGELIRDIVRGEDLAVDVQVTTTLAKGDVLDFVAVMDPEYVTADESTTTTAYKREAANRNFIIDALTVEYSNVEASATATSKWNGTSAASTTTAYAYNSEEVRFLQWYDANNAEINAGGTLSEGCYAKLNPEMVAAAGIDLENDSYADAFDKFVALLMKANVLTYANSDWKVGHLDAGSSTATFRELKYPFIYIAKNLGLVSSSGTVDTPNAHTNNDRAAGAGGTGALFVTEYVFETLQNELKSGFATYVSDETVKASNIQIAYDSTMNGVATSSARTHGHTVALMGAPHTTFARGGNTWGEAAYRYTAPKSGTVTFVVDALTGRYGGGSTTWNIAKNGVRVNATASTTTLNDATALASYQSAIAALSFTVEAGDTIDFLYAQSNYDNGYIPTITATMEYNPLDWAVEGQLKIDTNYSLNVLAVPADANGTMSAIVNGQTVAGEKQEDGSYKMLVQGDIYITDLASTVVSYALQEAVNGHVITGTTRTLDANELLTKYEAHENELVSRLAQDIRQLADYANFKLGNGSEPNATARTDMKRNDAALAALAHEYTFGGEAGAFKFVGANVNMDDSLRLILLIDASDAGANIADLMESTNGYAVKVYDGGQSLNLTTSEFGYVTAGGSEYVGVMVDVPVSYWSRALTFVLEQNGVAVSHSLNYSHYTWCSYVYNVKGGVGVYSDSYIARGVYNLGVSAAAYKASL
ncbi:MAG: hypothetical protein IJ009_00370 [Clostridia bacterium]|nr:hypothetical protein [Clostridia bacterium]